MPIYPYECPNGHYDEVTAKVEDWNAPHSCWNCNRPMHRVLGHASTHLFPAGMWEDIDVKPIEIRSKKQLEKECRSRGIYARNYMENYSPAERLIRYGG